MFGAWSKSSPVCGKAADTKQILDEQAKKALTTKQNSSGLYPGLAIIHNQASKESGAHVLSLPNVLLVEICRYASVNDAVITVSASNPALCKEPSLVEACKDIRAVARPVFYRESVFKCSVSMFNVVALQPWVRKREKAMQTTVDLSQILQVSVPGVCKVTKAYKPIQTKQIRYVADHVDQRTPSQLPQPTGLSWVVDNSPDWSNLVDWLKLYHQGSIGVYVPSGTLEPDQQTLTSVFGIVRVLRGQSWSLVLEVLEEAKVALSAANPAWAADDYDESQDVNLMNAGGCVNYLDVDEEESDDEDDLN